MTINPSLQHKIALSLLPNIGPKLARKLVAYVGSIEGVFYEKKSTLEKIPGLGYGRISTLNFTKVLEKAEHEIDYLHKNNIETLFYLDENYPFRLKECDDAPIVIFYKGKWRSNEFIKECIERF